MGRLIKWLLIGVAGLIGLLIAFVIVVVLVVDPNDYRDEIAAAVNDRTGRELTIEGELGLTFYPWFGLEVGRTRLADAEGFGPEPFAAIDRMRLAVNVLPLLTGELELDTIVLDGPRIRLVRDEAGKANWEQFPTGDGAAPGPGQPEGAGEAGGVPDIVRTLRLEGLVIDAASVVYDDRQAGTRVQLEPFNLELADVRLGGAIPVEAEWTVAVADGPRLNGSLTTTATVAEDLGQATLDALALSLTASGEAVPAGEQTVQLNAGVDANLADSVFTVRDLTVEGAGVTVNGNAEARLADGRPQASGRLAIPELSPRAVMEALAMEPPVTRDEDVLRAASANMQFRFADGRLHLQPIEASLDDTAVTGEATVRDFAGPGVDFQLDVDAIDVDRYLPPVEEDEGESEPVAGAPEGDGEGTAIPTEPLRRLDLNGRLAIGSLTVSGADMTNVDVTVTAKDGRIRVHPLVAELYEGRYSGDIRLDATGERLAVSVEEKLSGIQAEPLLTDLAGFGKLLGQGDFSLTANTSGADVTALLDGLKGEALLRFSDGSILGINVAQMLRQAMARLQGGQVEADAPKETDFTTLVGTVRIDGGTLRNDDLDIKTPLLRITGAGEANVVKQTVDYEVTLNVVGSLEGQGGADLTQLKSVPVPLRIQGPLTDPSFKLALADRLEAVARQRLEEEKAELEAKAEAELEAKQKELEAKGEEKKQELREKAAEKEKEVTDKVKEKANEEIGEKLKGLFN